MSQAQVAKRIGVTQLRVSDLMRGKIYLFGLDALVNVAAAAGLRVEMRVREAAEGGSCLVSRHGRRLSRPGAICPLQDLAQGLCQVCRP